MTTPEIAKVKKRDGSIVDFDAAKIKSAMQKAFLANAISLEPQKIEEIVEMLTKKDMLFIKNQLQKIKNQLTEKDLNKIIKI